MATNLYNTMYNPDVLSCIANLSNDEVFTPPEVANAMLDLLPQELFSDPNTTFLDPACKSGVFLREIAKRLLKGLEPIYPDLQERTDHIFKHQLYGIAITELTSHLSRRSLYCSKYANSRYSVSQFETIDGNVRFKRIDHMWGKTTYDSNGKPHTSCLFCGANKEQYDRGNELETHAYEMIHTSKPEEIFGMNFDVIISNPPYQLSDGGNGASATPIYHLFVQQAKKLKPRFLSMIIPARWFMGGRGLDAFRNEMLHDDRIRIIHDYPDASDCFPGVEIKGGVCYFLWNRDDRGLCTVNSHHGDNVEVTERPLLEDGMDTFIRNDDQISILHKVRSLGEDSISSWINAGRYYGFHTKVEWIDKHSHGHIQTADGKSYITMFAQPSKVNNVKVYIHGGECWLPLSSVPKNEKTVREFKIIIPRSGNPGGTILGRPRICEPMSCSSNTFVVVVPPEGGMTETKANSLLSYIKTKFFRYLVATKTATQDMAPRAYEFVPIQELNQEWTDELLYKKYNLSEREINAIETTIPEML